jgi:predicted MFS family arabinose efflux permease
MNAIAPPEAATQIDLKAPAYWSGVFAMSLGVFALIASEFMPISLLTPVAADLAITEGRAGQAIAVSGVFAVLTSLFISRLVGPHDRKTVLLAMTTLLALSGGLIGLAPNFTIYMAGRALIGVAIAGFWSISAAIAMRLVPSNAVPKALAIFNGGNALAAVVAAPLGTYLGSLIGWRGTFLSLVPIAALAFAWQWKSLPSMPAQDTRSEAGMLRLLARREVLVGMAGVSIFFMGQFALFTYLRPFLETVTGLDAKGVSIALLGLGAAGLIGTALIGRFLAGSLYRTLIVIPAAMAMIAVALIVWGDRLLPTVFLIGIWGLLATAAPVGWWAWVAKTLPQDAEAAGGLMVAVIQFAIAAGSSAGGVLFDSQGYGTTFAVSAALLVAATALALMTSRVVRKRSKVGVH